MQVTRLVLVLATGLSCGCAGLTGAPAVIDDAVALDAEAIGDADLIADVNALKNRRLSPSNGEVHAGMCLQQYVRGRRAELDLAKATDDYAQRVARSEMLQGFGTCAQVCKIAVEQSSKYSPMAAKYGPVCAEGSSESIEAIETDTLERLVATYRDAMWPLGLYLADKDATAAIEAIRDEGNSNDTVENLAKEVALLHQRHAEAIEAGRAFFEGPAAQANFGRRASNEAKQEALTLQINRLEAERQEAIDAGLLQRADNLRVEISATRVLLEAAATEHAALKTEYERMAAEAGVYGAPS